MSIEPKLHLTFCTTDFKLLKKNIKNDYYVYNGVTAIILGMDYASIVTYNGDTDEFFNGDAKVEVTEEVGEYPFFFHRAAHKVVMWCGCDEETINLFKDNVRKVAEAYILGRAPLEERERLQEINQKINALEIQEASARTAVAGAMGIAIDDALEELKDELKEKNAALKLLNDLITALSTYKPEPVSPMKAMFNIKPSDDKKRLEFVTTATNLHVCSGELKNQTDVANTIKLARNSRAILVSERDLLQSDVTKKNNLNQAYHQNKLLAAHQVLYNISSQIATLKADLSK